MLIDSTFEVPVSLEDVWPALLDIERIAPCLPGASIDERLGEGEYGGAMRIKLGPITSTFKGTLRIAEADQTRHVAVVEASARDVRGNGAAAATITSKLESTGSGTLVNVRTEMKLAGSAAQFGRGVVVDVSEKLLAEFASRLAAEIEHPRLREPAPSVDRSSASPEPRLDADAPSAKSARDDDVFDATAASRDALIRRAVPLAAVLGVLAALAAAVARRQRARPTILIEGPLFVFGARPHRWSRR